MGTSSFMRLNRGQRTRTVGVSAAFLGTLCWAVGTADQPLRAALPIVLPPASHTVPCLDLARTQRDFLVSCAQQVLNVMKGNATFNGPRYVDAVSDFADMTVAFAAGRMTEPHFLRDTLSLVQGMRRAVAQDRFPDDQDIHVTLYDFDVLLQRRQTDRRAVRSMETLKFN